MTHHTQETVAFVALVVVLAAMVGWGLRERRVERAMWIAYAARLGWRGEPGGIFQPQWIEGPLEGGEVTVNVELRGARAQRTRYTRCTARIGAALPRGFGAHARGMLDGVTRVIVGAGIETGDAAFDREVRLFGDAPDEVRRFLGTPERRAAVLDVVRAEARVTEGCVNVAVFGALGSEQALDELVRRTRGLARAIEEAGRSGSSLPEAPVKGY